MRDEECKYEVGVVEEIDGKGRLLDEVLSNPRLTIRSHLRFTKGSNGNSLPNYKAGSLHCKSSASCVAS